MGSCIILLLFGSLHIAQATVAYKMVTNINAGAFWATTIVSGGTRDGEDGRRATFMKICNEILVFLLLFGTFQCSTGH